VAKYNKFEDLAQTNHHSSTNLIEKSMHRTPPLPIKLAFGLRSGYNPRRLNSSWDIDL